MLLVLASRSPRRAEILQQMGLSFVVDSADIDESPLPGESPRDHVLRLATAKSRAVATRHPPDAVVLGGDTTVDVDGEIFGTPRDLDQARVMLGRLSGRTHEVHTAVCVMHQGESTCLVDSASVTMNTIGDEQLATYLATGESLDKAGAYAVQGHAAQFVEKVNGASSTVIGLPIDLVRQLLAPFGLLPSPPQP